MSAIRLAKDLELPLEAVTETLGLLGRRGSGKSYAAQKLAEEMHRLHAQFVVLDPVGIWYGLRLGADGKSPGLPIPVLGGLHGDIPLEATGGALIADLVVDRGASVVLDVSQFESDADKARFAQAFADRFFFRKKASPSAVHVFIEECQEFVPQNPQREEARMLHAFTRMAKIGRNFGIGMSLISQRPQEVNKKVLNLTEVLFCFQLTGPQERKTVQGWIAEKGINEDLADELPKLERGEPHVWSPAWLKISRRVKIGQKHTFDASSTPKVGKQAAARELSPIDLEQLRTDMAGTIERAKAEDPKLLHTEISRLKKLADDLATKRVADPASLEQAEHTGFERGRREILLPLRVLATEAKRHAHAAAGQINIAVGHIDDLEQLVEKVASTKFEPRPQQPPMPRASRPRPGPVERDPGSAGDGSSLSKAERQVLTVLAQLHPEPVNQDRLAILAGYSPNTGHFNNNVGALRSRGLITKGWPVEILEAGFFALGRYDPLPRGPELLAYWKGRLGKAEKLILTAAAEVYPEPLTKGQLAARAGYEANTGHFNNSLGRLRTMRLLVGRSDIKASEVFFQ